VSYSNFDMRDENPSPTLGGELVRRPKGSGRSKVSEHIPLSPPAYAKASAGRPGILAYCWDENPSPTLGGELVRRPKGGGRSEADEHIPLSPP